MNLSTDTRGFTLIELLAVIVVIGILAVSSFGGYSHFIEKARKKNAADVCEQIKVAWTSYHREMGFWPDDVSHTGAQAMDTDMCEILGKAQLLDVLYVDKDNNQSNGLSKNKDKEPELKYGLLDPVGLDLFKHRRSGSDVTDHLYQFVLDINEDGVIDSSDGLPNNVGTSSIRAEAAVWCWPKDISTAKSDKEPYAKSW